MVERVEKRAEAYEGGHKFLAEELLVPNLDKTDGGRINMFTSHITQCLVLDKMEIPKVFTNFENQIGQYSDSYKLADRTWTIIQKIRKNNLNYILLVKDQDNNIEVINMQDSYRITQRYGYLFEDKIHDKDVGDDIQENELIYRSSAHDDHLNFKYGTHLKAVYLGYKHLEYEDNH